MKTSFFVICSHANLDIIHVMQKIISAIGLLFCCAGVSAQSVTPEVIATSGGYFTSVNAQLSWTLGEPVVDTWSNVSNTLTQGFQQNSYYLSGIEELSTNLLVTAYPNPSVGMVNIRINGAAHDYIQAILINASGATIGQLTLTGINQCSFDLAPYASGAYTISILDNKQQKQSITIIKQ